MPSMLVSFPKSAPMMNLSQYVARFSFPMIYKVLLIHSEGKAFPVVFIEFSTWLPVVSKVMALTE